MFINYVASPGSTQNAISSLILFPIKVAFIEPGRLLKIPFIKSVCGVPVSKFKLLSINLLKCAKSKSSKFLVVEPNIVN